MINGMIRMLKDYAWFRRLNTRITYEMLSRYIASPEWHFMNYGYIPKECEKSEACRQAVRQQYSMQMYHYLASKTAIEGKKLLEIGSGRGGGAGYIAQSLKPEFYTGMDIASNAVALANKLHQAPNLKFIQGSAELIPFEDNSVDVVLNVESCHAYGSVPKFLSEVKRVLSPGGHLLLVDFRNSAENMKIFKEQLQASGLECVEEENISENVVRAIEAEDESKTEMIRKVVPTKWQKLFGQFAGTVGSPFHTTLKEGTRQYYRFVLRKIPVAVAG
jgi:ubiquinone/menaquinone biosynthesis C-methylase UbiE